MDFVFVVDEEEGEMVRSMRQMILEMPQYFKKVRELIFYVGNGVDFGVGIRVLYKFKTKKIKSFLYGLRMAWYKSAMLK